MNVQLLLLLAQAINLLAFVWFNREIRGEARPVSSAARGLPAQRVEAEIEKQGSAVHTVSRALEEEVKGQGWPAINSDEAHSVHSADLLGSS